MEEDAESSQSELAHFALPPAPLAVAPGGGEEADTEDFVDVADDDQEASSDDEVESHLAQGSVFHSGALGRVFFVERVQKATGGHRPSILFDGRLQEIVAHGAGHRLQHVAAAKELQLSLRYEPPSPKFARSCPDMTSYRLKLLQGTQFIYLLRGLPRVLAVDVQARAVGWGVLQLVFATHQQLDSFLAVLRHVSVVHDQLWPRHIASLLRTATSTPGEPAAPAPAPAAEAALPAAPAAAGPTGGVGPQVWGGHRADPSTGDAGGPSSSTALRGHTGHAGAEGPIPPHRPWGAWLPSWVEEHRLLVGGAVVLGASVLLVALVGTHRRGHGQVATPR